MSKRYKSLIKGKLQTSGGKVEKGETSWIAVVRELEEKTRIKGYFCGSPVWWEGCACTGGRIFNFKPMLCGFVHKSATGDVHSHIKWANT